MWRARATAADLLNQYWNRRVAVGSATPPSELDPSLTATLERLYSRDDAEMPDARLLDRVEQTLIDTIALQPGMRPITHLVAPHANGRANPTTQPPKLQPVSHPRLGQWLLPRLATAALIAMLLIGSVVTLRGFRPAEKNDAPAIIPAWEGTPEAPLPPGVTEATTLFDQRVDDIPIGAGWAGVEQTTLGPGAGMAMGTSTSNGVGPLLYRVESGAVTGRAAGTAMVTRAGAVSAFPVAAGQPIDLAAGDVAFVPSGIASEWHNATNAEAKVMDAGITTMGLDTRSLNGIEVPGWSEGNVLAFQATIDSLPQRSLRSPSRLLVQRVGLAPGGTMENPATPGLAFIGVETGSVTLIAADPAAPGKTRILKAHEWIGVNGASADALQGAPYDTREFRNDGDANATFVLMIIAPIAAEATPVAERSTTPMAATGEETLFHQVLDAIPADAMWAGIERAVIDPGKDWPQGSPQTTTGLGPMLYRVERGEATVHVEGQIVVTRAGAQNSAPMSAGTVVTLEVGDVAYVPTGVLTDWRNEQASPLVILDAGVANPWGAPPPVGVQKSSPIDADNLEIPRAPAELTVRRLTLPPGASIAGGPVPGLKLVAVEAGTLTIDWADNGNRSASGQQPGATPTSRVILPRDYVAGSWADVNRAGTLASPKGAEPFATTLRNDGSEPVTLLVLTVVSLAPDATSTGS